MKNSNCKRGASLIFVTLTLALTVDTWPATRSEQGATPQKEQWEQYRLILDRNIFSRQRGPVRRAGDGTEPNVVVPNPETHFVLKGVVQQDREFIAFIEDTQAGRVLRLRQDGRVARGMVKALDLDGIEYELEGHVTAIKLGYDLEGRLAPVPVSAAPPAVTSTSTATASPPTRRTQTNPPQSTRMQTSQPQAGTAPSTPTPAPAAPAPSPAVDEAEILKRLMEQRQQELGQP